MRAGADFFQDHLWQVILGIGLSCFLFLCINPQSCQAFVRPPTCPNEGHPDCHTEYLVKMLNQTLTVLPATELQLDQLKEKQSILLEKLKRQDISYYVKLAPEVAVHQDAISKRLQVLEAAADACQADAKCSAALERYTLTQSLCELTADYAALVVEIDDIKRAARRDGVYDLFRLKFLSDERRLRDYELPVIEAEYIQLTGKRFDPHVCEVQQ